MNPYIKKVQPLDNYCLMIWFENEEQKIFDVKPYLSKGVFSQLKDPSVFTSVHVVAGSVEWSNGIDLSYDTPLFRRVSINFYGNLSRVTNKSLPYLTIQKPLRCDRHNSKRSLHQREHC
jgi:Protein of unknown function (DUF2442)